MISHSFPSSFTPWVGSLVTSSSSYSVSPSLVSSVPLGSSASVACVGGLNLAQSSFGGLSIGVSSAPAVAGSSFAMSSILAPVSSGFCSGVSSSCVSVSSSSPTLVESAPPVVVSLVAGSIPSVPGVGVVSGIASAVWGGGGELRMVRPRIRMRLLFLRQRVR